MAEEINAINILPLANSKGVRFVCQLCNGPAYLKCGGCEFAYYCGMEHMKLDVIGIHKYVCPLMVLLEKRGDPIPFQSAMDSAQKWREHRNHYLKDIIDIADKVTRRHLFENHASYAIPAALQHMHSTTELYGQQSVNLALSFCLLSEASVGIHRIAKATSYLSQAWWLIVKNPTCPDFVQYRLYRANGIIHEANRNFDQARQSFADAIYYASEAFGHADIRTSGCYFLLGKVFNELNETSVAESIYDRITDIWCEHLTDLVRTVICGPIIHKTEPYNRDARHEVKEYRCLDEAEAAEASLVLNFIYNIKNGAQYPEKVPKTSHCLAMLYLLREDVVKAEKFGTLVLFENEDLPYKRDAVEFLSTYTEEREKMHRLQTGSGEEGSSLGSEEKSDSSGAKIDKQHKC